MVGANDVFLPKVLIKAGDVQAVTLDNVIVFRNNQGMGDLGLWAHELCHVYQYSMWGIETFADRYTRDFSRVEDPAYELQARIAP